MSQILSTNFLCVFTTLLEPILSKAPNAYNRAPAR